MEEPDDETSTEDDEELDVDEGWAAGGTAPIMVGEAVDRERGMAGGEEAGMGGTGYRDDNLR